MLFPVIWMFFACFKTNNEIFGSLSLLPQGWSPEAFIKGWKTTGTYTYARYFINTFALVVPTTLLTVSPIEILKLRRRSSAASAKHSTLTLM